VRQRGGGGACVDGLALWWEVLADAPGLEAMLTGGATPTTVRIVLFIEGSIARAFLEFRRGEHAPPETITLGDALPVTMDAIRSEELVHLEIPGVLRASVLAGPGAEPRVVYARTTLLEALGLRGGMYDRPGAAWERR
jgi:hypothetical protein